MEEKRVLSIGCSVSRLLLARHLEDMKCNVLHL